jgi:hypothetical protein
VKNSWIEYARESGFVVRGETIDVTFKNQRHHVVTVLDMDDIFSFRAVVAAPSIASGIPDIAIRAWLRNRAIPLVGFRIDETRRLIGEAWVPKAGLTKQEFLLYVRSVASECDRFEHQLTGDDKA